MNITRMNCCAVILSAIALTGLSSISMSTPSWEEVPTKTVRFSDLNVSTEAGAKALYGRIRLAARDVCETSMGSDAILRVATHACIEKSVDDAVRRVNAPALTALRFGPSAVRLASE